MPQVGKDSAKKIGKRINILAEDWSCPNVSIGHLRNSVQGGLMKRVIVFFFITTFAFSPLIHPAQEDLEESTGALAHLRRTEPTVLKGPLTIEIIKTFKTKEPEYKPGTKLTARSVPASMHPFNRETPKPNEFKFTLKIASDGTAELIDSLGNITERYPKIAIIKKVNSCWCTDPDKLCGCTKVAGPKEESGMPLIGSYIEWNGDGREGYQHWIYGIPVSESAGDEPPSSVEDSRASNR